MPDDRLFHKRLGHSEKVNALSDLEDIVWRTYIQAADDFGVMRFSPLPLQDFYDRLAKHSTQKVMRMLERVAEVGLVSLFDHQGRTYCYQVDWQDYQKIRYALATANPRIPAPLLADCSIATQWLHTLWPGGGGRGKKLKNWTPEKTWTPPNWEDRSGNGSGNGSRTVPDRNARHADRTARHPGCPVPVSSTQLELLPPVLVHTAVSTNLPALSRRPVDSLLKTHVEADEATASVDAGALAAALPDRPLADRGGADDVGQRVESADSRSAGALGVRAATDERTDPRGHGGRREGARTAVGTAADGAGDAGSTAATAAPGGPALGHASRATGPLHPAADADDPAGARALDTRTLVDQLRQLAAGGRRR